jgi:hypothetical protein
MASAILGPSVGYICCDDIAGGVFAAAAGDDLADHSQLHCRAAEPAPTYRTLRRTMMEPHADWRRVTGLTATAPRRSAKSQAVACSRALARGGLPNHSATAKQYCPSSSTVARLRINLRNSLRKGPARSSCWPPLSLLLLRGAAARSPAGGGNASPARTNRPATAASPRSTAC